MAGCDHKTVAHWVRQRELTGGNTPARRARPAMDGFEGKVAELVEHSKGRVRADVAHRMPVAMGYAGLERTTRRWVAFRTSSSISAYGSARRVRS